MEVIYSHLMEEENNNTDDLQEIISSLKSENSSLRKEIQQLQSAKNPEEGQLAYEESQMRFRTIFELSTLGNKVISSNLEIIQVNPAMVSLLGYTSKEEII